MSQWRGGPEHSGSSPAQAPADSGGAGRAGHAAAAEAAALTTRLILLGHSANLSAAAAAGLERAVLAQLEAVQSLRRYPLKNSDEPMTVTGRGPGECP